MAETRIVTSAAELIAALGAAPAPAAFEFGLSDPLADLPAPAAIEEIDVQADLGARLAHYADLCEGYGLERPEFLDLESAPERILLEEASYLAGLMRARVNSAYRSSLLYYAAGGDLDHVAEASGVTRLSGETDDALRRRVRVRNRGSSAAGAPDWWRAHALAAHPGIEDVAVTRPAYPYPAPGEQRGSVTLSVLSKTADGAPSQEMLEAVTAAATSPAVRNAASAVIVQPATRTEVGVVAEIWLRPDALPGTFEALPQRLLSAWEGARGIGWDVVASWMTAALMAPGVARVELTGWTDVAIAEDEAPLLGDIDLTLRS